MGVCVHTHPHPARRAAWRRGPRRSRRGGGPGPAALFVIQVRKRGISWYSDPPFHRERGRRHDRAQGPAPPVRRHAGLRGRQDPALDGGPRGGPAAATGLGGVGDGMADDPIDALYAADLEDFVGARDALAKRLRADGDREGAAAVKKLVKPTRAAWAVNRLVRDRPDEVRALVQAGDALAGAQEQLLDGADAAVLRGAAEAARALVDALAAQAPVDGPLRDKVRATLHAATVDAQVRDEVAAGRVLKERSAAGFGGLEALVAAGRGAAEAAPATPAKGKRAGAGAKGARKAARD